MSMVKTVERMREIRDQERKAKHEEKARLLQQRFDEWWAQNRKNIRLYSCEYEISTQTGWKTVRGFKLGDSGLGVHQSETGNWVITHLNSGLMIVSTTSKAKARMLIALVNTYAPWHVIKPDQNGNTLMPTGHAHIGQWLRVAEYFVDHGASNYLWQYYDDQLILK